MEATIRSLRVALFLYSFICESLKDFGAVVQRPGIIFGHRIFFFFGGRGGGVVGIFFLYISALCEKDGRY